jgi:ribonuclease D
MVRDVESLDALCQRVAGQQVVGLDSEFVGENRDQPLLCLLQLALAHELVIVDTMTITDVRALWEVLANDVATVVVHAAREECRFCLAAIGRMPRAVFDVQLASAFLTTDYPESYSRLVERWLAAQIEKGDTRTEWRRRPLAPNQLQYAVQDVVYLLPLYERLTSELARRSRTNWMAEEQQRQLAAIAGAGDGQRWQKLAGLKRLGPASLAIVEALWHWREQTSARRNVSARRLLRDDLIVELARRRLSDAKGIRQLRGLEHRWTSELVPEIAAVIQQALARPAEEWPRPLARSYPEHLDQVVPLLNAAVAVECSRASIASQLVATTDHVRQLLYSRVDPDNAEPGLLASGWRRALLGDRLERLLAGQTAIRIGDLRSPEPVRICEV